jgi:hypothetical protein
VGSYHGSYYTMDSIEPSCTSNQDALRRRSSVVGLHKSYLDIYNI